MNPARVHMAELHVGACSRAQVMEPPGVGSESRLIDTEYDLFVTVHGYPTGLTVDARDGTAMSLCDDIGRSRALSPARP
jgi:hypothetical protein